MPQNFEKCNLENLTPYHEQYQYGLGLSMNIRDENRSTIKSRLFKPASICNEWRFWRGI
jgi:hypothetical protein